MSTSSTVTTGLVSHRYGEEAAKATHEGLDAAGHAIGTAWAVFKVRKALNPKSVLKPTTLVKSAAKAAAAAKKKAKSSNSNFHVTMIKFAKDNRKRQGFLWRKDE
ncbi:hypothetical protein RJ639_025955 [Escallonia herrerae]|uniref:Senescence domain-containing protein n=1 Tax=Escallonia herrerae TaxID=1293975 RepID=A0AA88RVR4_9ASTE|nr:hypothetical protein RJ639_025955 [Escallonia herrerae]